MRDGRTQIEIARKLGISYQAYQKLENPRKCNPTIKTLERIGEVMGKRLSLIWT
jgi:antitoxin HicB